MPVCMIWRLSLCISDSYVVPGRQTWPDDALSAGLGGNGLASRRRTPGRQLAARVAW